MLQVLPKRSVRAQPPTGARCARHVMAGVRTGDHHVYSATAFDQSANVLLHLPTSLAINSGLVRFILGFQTLGSNTPSHGLVASLVRRRPQQGVHTRLCSSVLQLPCEVDEPTPV